MSVQIEEKLGLAKSKFQDAKVILENPVFNAEEKAKAEKLIKEAQDLKTEAAQLQLIEDSLATLPDVSKLGGIGQAEQPKGNQPKKFSDLRDYVKALRRDYNSKGRDHDQRLEGFQDHDDPDMVKTLSSSAGADGGYLLPTEMYDQLMSVAAPMTTVRRRATVLPMSARTMQLNSLDQTATDGMAGGYFGGVVAYWEAEAASIEESSPKFRKVEYVAHELVAYTPIPNSMMQDASLVSITAFLSGPFGFPGAIAWKEDYAFLRGTGVGQPLGLISAPCTLAVSRNTAGTITYEDLTSMLVRHMGNAPVWIAHRMVMEKLLQMTGHTGNPLYLWGDAVKGVPNTLLGIPIEFVDKLPTVGNQGDIVLGDLSYYIIADRQRTSMAFSQDYLFRTNQTAARAVHRVDGRPWLNAPITFVDGETQVSPFVVLTNAGT